MQFPARRCAAVVVSLLFGFPFYLNAGPRNRDDFRVDVQVEHRSAPAKNASPWSAPADFEELVRLMNRERVANGLAPLHLSRVLSAAAADRIDDMFAKHYFDHVSPEGMEPFVWAERRGYDYRAMGENLAIGYRGADAVVDGWMHSSGHRRNVLGSEYADVGVAIASGSPTSRFTGPTVVALYGAER